jgi:2-polyprenyl-3-methyl-5-hydroxy-6-metoxy-1,4-benzoquinol methylase
MYVVHGLSKQEMDAFYNEHSYFEAEYGGGAAVNYLANKLEQDEKANLALSIIHRFEQKGRLLEIGCAGGYLLEVARDKFGYDVAGVELSEEMCAEGRARGLDIFCGSIEDAPVEWQKFDVIYLGDVLEHIATPKPFMDAINGRLNIGGQVAIELPLTYNLTLSGIVIGLVNLLKGNWGYQYFLPAQHRRNYANKPPYHVLMFNRASIRSFLKLYGFRVRYLKIYEGKPKEKFSGSWYGRFKALTHWLTFYFPQNFLGDRIFVVAEKI